MAKDKSPLDVVDPTPIPQPDPQPAPVDPMDVRAPATTTAPAQPALDPIDKGLDADADQRTGAQEALLKSSMLSAMQDQPDKQAQILKLNDKLGFSNIVDKQTFDAASQQEKLQSIDYRRMLTAHPELAKWLTIRSNAAVAHDEVPQLQAWSEQAQRLDGTPHDTNGILPDGYMFQKDGTIRGPVSAEPGKEPVIYKSLDVLRAKLLREEGQQYTDQFVADAAAKVLDQHWFPSLFAGAEGSVSGTLSALSHVTGGYQTDSLLGMTMPEMKVGSEQIGAASEQLNPGFTGSMGRVVGQLVGDAPLYLLGGEVAGLADLATSLRAIKAATALPETVPSIYLKDAWKTALAYSPIAARSGINTGSEHGAAYGSLDFLINAIGPASFGSKFGLAHAIVPGAETAAASAGWTGVAQRLMLHAGSQGGIMAATELANALHEYATGVDPDALKQENLLPRLGQSFAMGSALSTAFHISSEVGGHYRAQQVAAHAAMMDAGALGRLMEASEALNVPERTPEHFQELLQASIPESQRTKFFQTDDFEGVAKAANVEPQELADQMGIGKEYKQALVTGQRMTVPTHLLLKWGMEHEDPNVKGELLRAARSNAVGINANEALKFYKESPDQLAQQKLDLESDVTKTAAGLKESDPIFHDIMTKYEEAGQVSDAARTNAKLMAAFFHVQAKRWNFDATARGAKLMDPQDEYENSHLQVVKGGQGNYVEAMDALLNRVREGNVPTEKQAYGKSLTEYLAGRGIKDENGALKKIGADTLIDENGHDLELAAERAHDEGYIEDKDPQTLLDAIKQEAGGRPVFASANRNEDLHQLRSGAVALAQHLASKGINIASPNEEIKAALAGDPMMARFEQRLEVPSAHLRHEYLLKQWKKAHGDRSPTPGDKDWMRLQRQASMVDEAQGRFFQPAYHGSPRDRAFKKFSDEKMGTGEGSQTHGWGHYATSKKDLANYYRAYHSGLEIKYLVDGKEAFRHEPDHGERTLAEKAITMVAGNGSVEKALRVVNDWEDREIGSEKMRTELRSHINALTGKQVERVETAKGGRLYHVDVPEKEHLLQENEPLAAQSEYVRKALEKELAIYRDSEGVKGALPTGTGRQIYKEFVFTYGSEEAASKRLSELGVKGIEYPMNSIGDKKEGGGSGYVVFDANDMRINKVEQPGTEGPRGSLEFDSTRHFVMTLNGNADLSTVAHEAGHFWLEKMGEFAMREGAPPQMRSDYQKILEFVGYGTHENKNAMMQEAYDLQRKISSAGRDATASEASRLKELADPHEKFARSIEQYLMEGHAPSPELRGAFQRFAIWLGHIYRQVKSLVTLTPEVRGIFDRLLATDDAIEQVQKELGTSTIFKDQASSGMKDAEWASYLASIQRERERSQSNVFAKAMATLRRENTRAYNREKDRALSRAAEIIKNRPVNIIVNEMVHRVDRDGNEIAETPKLSRADVEKNYGSAKELPRGITQDEGGMSLEAAADAYHFGSAAELWTALANYRKPKEQIAEMADAFIKAEHPELTPEALHEAAMEAVHANNAHADVLGRESAALAIRALRTPIPQEQMKQIAERMVAETNHRDVKPEVHLRAEIKASDQSTEAFLKEPPDYTAAFLHKQRQELSHALYRASMEAQEVIEKTGALMKKLGKYETRQMLGRAGGYVIVGKNGERFVTMDAAEAEALAKEYDGRTMNFRDAADALGDMWDDRPTRFDMDFGAVSDLYQEATAIHFQAKTAFDLIVQGKKEDLAQAIDAAIKSQVDATGGKMVVVPRDKRTFRYKLGDFAVRLETGNRTLHGILRSLDGEKADGWHYRNIGRPLNEAQDDEVIRKIANAKEMRGLTKDWGKRGRKDPVFIPSIGESLNLEQRIGVALNAGTRHNLERMQTGDGWTTAQIKSIVGTLDEKDIALVKGIWGLLASKWPEISAMHTKTEGVPPEAKATIPVETRFGTIDGGYYPILYDKARGARAFELSLEKPASPILGKPGSGFTKTSLETTGMKLQYGFDALFRHLDDTAHYLSHKEAQVNINKIVNNKDFQQSIVDHFGIRTFERMAERIQNVLQGPRGPQNAFEEGARFLRTRSGLATCGYNAMTVLVHGFGIPQSMHVVGMGKWLSAQGEICTSAGSLESAGRFIDSKSSFMKNSHHNVTPETAERLNQGMAGGVLQTIQGHALDGLHLALRTINRATWLAEYRTRMEEMPNDEPRAIELANQAVRDTQGSGQTVDKTYFQDANEFSKMFMQYASFFTRTYQLLRPSIAHFDKSDPATYWAAMKAFLPLVMLPAVTEGLFREAIKPSSDNDNSPEFWATRLAKDNIEYLLSSFIGGREVSGMVEGFDYKGPASMRSLGSVGAAFGNIKKFLEDADSSSANRAGRSALGIAGLAFGIPSNQIDHIIQGILHDQDEDSVNPLPLLFGPPRN